MPETPRSDSPTVRAHKRQFAWQILAPVLVVTAVVAAAAVFTVTGGTAQTRVWADVSIIWLIAPLLVMALLFAVLLGYAIHAVAKLLEVTPRFTAKAQFYTAAAAAGTHRLADGITKPVIWVRQITTAIKSFFDKL
ncbi:MAG TPA: hypothetical protein VMC09_00270 [Anaerolineales bacterium]|nr:hypothetical protein [Anaerolineales bacterium]